MIFAALLLGTRALVGRSVRCVSSRAHTVASARPTQQLAALAPSYFEALNVAAFESELPADLVLRWNPRLRRTAGRCRFITMDKTRHAEIELSPRVLTSADRLRTTLAHEMCHAAQWLVDGEARPPHGAAFRRWARLLEERVPDILITTTHSYAINTRYVYRCTSCGQTYGRHSRMCLETRCCGRCRGALTLDSEDSTEPTRAPPPFANFVRREYAAQRKRWPHVSHQRIMTALGRKWRRRPRKARKAVA